MFEAVASALRAAGLMEDAAGDWTWEVDDEASTFNGLHERGLEESLDGENVRLSGHGLIRRRQMLHIVKNIYNVDANERVTFDLLRKGGMVR